MITKQKPAADKQCEALSACFLKSTKTPHSTWIGARKCSLLAGWCHSLTPPFSDAKLGYAEASCFHKSGAILSAAAHLSTHPSE